MAGKEPLVYIDGEHRPKGSAKISVYDHGLLYGDGVFEGIRAYNGIVFHLRDHIERLFEGLRVTRINVSLSKEEMANVVVEALRKNNMMDAYIGLAVTRGRGDLGLDTRRSPTPSTIVGCEPIAPANGKQARDRQVTGILSSYRQARGNGEPQ